MNYCVAQGPEEIKKEIIKNGPVIGSITPFTDFLTYKDGTYFPSEGSFKFNGHQPLKIIGWEKDPQGDVWIVENSWGNQWGDKGYARIVSGHKDLYIDYLGVAPRPIPMPAHEWDQETQRMQKQYEASVGESTGNANEANVE